MIHGRSFDFRALHRAVDNGPVFAASFDGGECAECGDDVLEGDEVLYVAGELTHRGCWEDL